MIGSKSKSKEISTQNLYGSPDNATTCVISSGSVIEGKFSSKENVRLDGRIVGEVRCEHRIVMGDTGIIEGILHSGEAVIMGKIKGDLFIHGSLTLKSTAQIQGNIQARIMSVEEGAVYNGECKIGNPGN